VVARNESIKLHIPKNLPPGSEKYFQSLFDVIQNQEADDDRVKESPRRRRRTPKR
jgi:hypothetical protein